MNWIYQFKEVPRWLFLAGLLWAPWAFGSTRLWTITAIKWVLGVIVGTWILDHLLRRKWPEVSPWLLAFTLPIMGLGWFMVFNAVSIYDSDYYNFIPLEQRWEWAPGSKEKSLSFSIMTRWSLLFAASWMACDLASRPVWRKRIWWTIALCGASIALLGIMQRLTGAPGIFWQKEEIGPLFFGTYRYHANAGAFMNLAWPLMAGLTVMAFRHPRNFFQKNVTALGMALLAAACFVNTSRASAFVAAVLGLLFLGWLLFQYLQKTNEKLFKTRIAAMIAVLFCVSMLAVAGGLQTSLKRWTELDDQWNNQNSRLLTSKVCMEIIPKSGLFGYGPGTFPVIFPFFTHPLGKKVAGFWRNAHQDYLQTTIEYGWLGAGFWLLWISGGMVSGLRKIWELRNAEQRSGRTEEKIWRLCLIFSVCGVLLHALVDFPLQIASIQLYFAVALGLLYQTHLHRTKPEFFINDMKNSGLSAARRRTNGP